MPKKDEEEKPPAPPSRVVQAVYGVGGALATSGTTTVEVSKAVGTSLKRNGKWAAKKTVEGTVYTAKNTVAGTQALVSGVGTGLAIAAEEVGIPPIDLGELLFAKADEDDEKCLPAALRKIYRNPFRPFGIDPEDAPISRIRDAFRKQIMSFCISFAGLPRSKMTLQQILFAYHMLRKTVTGPAEKIMRTFRTNPFLSDFQPEDLLPLLRPLRGKFPCAPQYRGFRNLNIICSGYTINPIPQYSPNPVFVFTVHYCLRIHTITKDYKQCAQLHRELCSELLCLPSFPENNLLDRIPGYFSYEYRGEQLSDYIRKVHRKVASGGFFSPRLFEFLGIDFGKVQSEEEGAIMALLDNPQPPPGTCWYMVDEAWLAKWRRFAMGRGPRRYLPPGRITNSDLRARALAPGRKELKKGVDYRCVTYNVWKFFELVHGGGPTIARKDQEIYSDITFSFLQGVVWAQTHARMRIAQKFRRRLYMERLSKSQTAKALIFNEKSKQVVEKMMDMLNEGDKERAKRKLVEAANITRTIWRNKKNIIKEEQLERVKSDQEVFARSRGQNADEPGEEGLVVRDVHPVIHIGSTTMYRSTVTEDEGFPKDFKIRRVPGTETAMIGDPGTEKFAKGSKIMSINGYPASAMTYEMLKRRLGSGSYPYTIELERPTAARDVPTLDDLFAMTEPMLRYNAFKLILKAGLHVIRHEEKNKSYFSTIRISETDFFYKDEYDKLKSDDALWHNFCLLETKFVSEGAEISLVTDNKKLEPRHEFFFSISTHEDLEVCFELITDVDELEQMAADAALERSGGKNVQREKGKEAAFKEDIRRRKFKKFVQFLRDQPPGDVEAGFDPTDFERQMTLAASNDTKALNAFEAEKEERMETKMEENKDSLMAKYQKEKARVFVIMMKKLVDEIRGSQIYLDKSGVPTMRKKAKTSLRKIS